MLASLSSERSTQFHFLILYYWVSTSTIFFTRNSIMLRKWYSNCFWTKRTLKWSNWCYRKYMTTIRIVKARYFKSKASRELWLMLFKSYLNISFLISLFSLTKTIKIKIRDTKTKRTFQTKNWIFSLNQSISLLIWSTSAANSTNSKLWWNLSVEILLLKTSGNILIFKRAILASVSIQAYSKKWIFCNKKH